MASPPILGSGKEPVWSPPIEAALIEALEKYRPGGRPNRVLRRFPKRNRFISDYIYTVTGARRTPKQVGSHLQQIGATCSDKRILDLVFGRSEDEDEGTPSDPSDSPAPSTSDSADETTRSFIFISVTPSSFPTASRCLGSAPPPTSAAPSPFSILDDEKTAASPPQTFITIRLLRPHEKHPPATSAILTSGPRRRCVYVEYPSEIGNSQPVLAFATSRTVSISQHYCYCRVLIGGVLLHAEVTALAFIGTHVPPVGDRASRHTYSTKFIPLYWKQLCRSFDLSHCVIEQDIYQTQEPFTTAPISPRPTDNSIRHITYHFYVPSTTVDSAPAPTPRSKLFHPPPLPSEPSLPPEFPSTLQKPLRFKPYIFSAPASPPTPLASTSTSGNSSVQPQPSAGQYADDRRSRSRSAAVFSVDESFVADRDPSGSSSSSSSATTPAECSPIEPSAPSDWSLRSTSGLAYPTDDSLIRGPSLLPTCRSTSFFDRLRGRPLNRIRTPLSVPEYWPFSSYDPDCISGPYNAQGYIVGTTPTAARLAQDHNPELGSESALAPPPFLSLSDEWSSLHVYGSNFSSAYHTGPSDPNSNPPPNNSMDDPSTRFTHYTYAYNNY